MNDKIVGIGLMSGTSLDGIDLAVCEFDFSESKPAFRILKAKTFEYDEIWRSRLRMSMQISGHELMKLDCDYGKFSADRINDFLESEKLKIDFISSHGHTVFHQPEHSFSTQIGSGAVIAAQTGVDTICDFRSTDVALGGQGAPLVPVGDELLFSDYDACLNIGGIANISFKKGGHRIAFDICAANMILNFLAEKLDKKMDEGGELAKRGNIQAVLLQNLNMHPFFQITEKKSLGKEWVEENMIRKIEMSNVAILDKLRTCTEHIAQKIAEVIIKNKLKKILVTGGGTYNGFLIERIRSLTQEEIIIPENQIVEFKEALIFALLGALRLKNKINVLSSVTGAKRNSCSGTVYLGS